MNEMEEHETHHHHHYLWSLSSSQRSTTEEEDDNNDEEDDDKTLTMFREDLGEGEKENARPPAEESRYEQIPDTVAALQDSHKALLSQLRETQEMLEVVLEDNDKLRRQYVLCLHACLCMERMMITFGKQVMRFKLSTSGFSTNA